MSDNIYIVYETTNLVNGKYYIGKMNVKIAENGYIGSGTLFKKSLKKYGKSNFIFEILKEFKNEKDAYDYERNIVDINMVHNKNCYNIMVGGDGACSGIDNHFYGKHHKNVTKNMMSNIKKGKFTGRNNPMYGRRGIKSPIYGIKQSEEHKEKRSKALKGISLSSNHKKNLSGKNNYKSKIWFIYGYMFYSSRSAGLKFNVDKSTIINWCNMNIPHCFSIGKGKKI